MAGASKPMDMSRKRQRIAQLARQSPALGFTTLAYLIDLDWLTEAFDRTRKAGAVGVDGQDGEAYAADLRGNLQALRDRAKSGTYQAPPVRRVHIPKAGAATATRPLRIPTSEDKEPRKNKLVISHRFWFSGGMKYTGVIPTLRSKYETLQPFLNEAFP